MTLFDWMDRHWFVAGWCSVIVMAGVASVLHALAKRITPPKKRTPQAQATKGEE